MKHLDITDNYLQYFNINLANFDLSQFYNIEHVIMQGSRLRARELALKYYQKTCAYSAVEPVNLLPDDAYFVIYRVGKVLFVSHGMGVTSILALLNNLTKLMSHTQNTTVKYIRSGTSGGINVKAGTVIISEKVYMPNLTTFQLQEGHNSANVLSHELNQKIIQAQPQHLKFKVLMGNSIAANDFYLGQARLDGALRPSFNREDREAYFAQIAKLNILNFEMEATALAYFCQLVKIPAAMVAVTLVDRALGDQVAVADEVLSDYYSRPGDVVINYLTTFDR